MKSLPTDLLHTFRLERISEHVFRHPDYFNAERLDEPAIYEIRYEGDAASYYRRYSYRIECERLSYYGYVSRPEDIERTLHDVLGILTEFWWEIDKDYELPLSGDLPKQGVASVGLSLDEEAALCKAADSHKPPHVYHHTAYWGGYGYERGWTAVFKRPLGTMIAIEAEGSETCPLWTVSGTGYSNAYRLSIRAIEMKCITDLPPRIEMTLWGINGKGACAAPFLDGEGSYLSRVKKGAPREYFTNRARSLEALQWTPVPDDTDLEDYFDESPKMRHLSQYLMRLWKTWTESVGKPGMQLNFSTRGISPHFSRREYDVNEDMFLLEAVFGGETQQWRGHDQEHTIMHGATRLLDLTMDAAGYNDDPGQYSPWETPGHWRSYVQARGDDAEGFIRVQVQLSALTDNYGWATVQVQPKAGIATFLRLRVRTIEETMMMAALVEHHASIYEEGMATATAPFEGIAARRFRADDYSTRDALAQLFEGVGPVSASRSSNGWTLIATERAADWTPDKTDPYIRQVFAFAREGWLTLGVTHPGPGNFTYRAWPRSHEEALAMAEYLISLPALPEPSPIEEVLADIESTDE